MVLDGDGASLLLQLYLYVCSLSTYGIILTDNIGGSNTAIHLHL